MFGLLRRYDDMNRAAEAKNKWPTYSRRKRVGWAAVLALEVIALVVGAAWFGARNSLGTGFTYAFVVAGLFFLGFAVQLALVPEGAFYRTYRALPYLMVIIVVGLAISDATGYS